MKWKSSWTISLFNFLTISLFDYLPDEDGKKVYSKNEDEDEKNLEEWTWFLSSPYEN